MKTLHNDRYKKVDHVALNAMILLFPSILNKMKMIIDIHFGR